MINNALFSSKTEEWSTPQKFYDELNKEFNFSLDPCANETNAKCPKYFTKSDDGLAQSWDNETVFCNPPYGRAIGDWVKKASESRGGSGNAHPSQNRYKIFSRIYLPQSRNKVYKRSFEIWR